WPARHRAGINDATLPPMGARFRLKSTFDISSFGSEAKVVLTAFKHYGLIVADNGSDWFFQGTEDAGWNTAAYDTMVSQLKTVPASAFEAIDESALMVNPNSAQAGTVPAQPAAPSAAPGNGRAIVTWSPPANGGQPITGYTITGTPGGTAVAGGTATAAIVFGLANGTSYTFTVTARNVVGTGPPSPPSNPVVPNSRLVAPSSPAPSGGRPPVTQVPPQPPPPRIVWLQPAASCSGSLPNGTGWKPPRSTLHSTSTQPSGRLSIERALLTFPQMLVGCSFSTASMMFDAYSWLLVRGISTEPSSIPRMRSSFSRLHLGQ